MLLKKYILNETKRDISWIVSNNICYSCGVCEVICPVNCIDFSLIDDKGVFLPKIDYSICIDCAKCEVVCPSVSNNINSKEVPSNKYLGNTISAYSSCSSNEEIRYNSASGGSITSFLIGLLEMGVIDAALVSSRKNDNQLIGESFLAYTKEDILNAKSSIYSPVNITGALHKLETIKSTKKIAVVGLPCQIQGIINIAKKSKNLKNKIFLKLSIICGQSPSLLAYNYIFHKINEEPNNISKINNRGLGWPGFLTISNKFNNVYKFKYESFYSMGSVLSSPLFTPTGCQMCLDSVGLNADITFSDAWLERFKDDEKGMNLVLIKTELGKQLFLDISEKGYLKIKSCHIDDFIFANSRVIKKKDFSITLRKIALFRIKKKLPNKENNFNSKIIVFLKMLIFYFHIWTVWKLKLNTKNKFLIKPVIFYFKIINLIKR